MREILFRGKSKDTGKWVYGYYRKIEWTPNTVSHNIHPIGSYEWDDVWEVIPETLGQWIGLCDKNGNKIFEGDVLRDVRYKGKDDVLILFKETSFQYAKKSWHDGYSFPLDDTESDCLADICEIVGNIHDNPELMK